MSDRKLLEDAAKAAGYVLVWGDKYKLGDDEIDCTDIPYIRSGQPDEGDIFWNPITDDGDALRLAVKLGLSLDIFGPTTTAVRHDINGATQTNMTDHYAATRRAIVRAAAEIGRGVARPVNDALPEDNYYKSMAEAEEAGRAAAKIGRGKK